MKQLKIAIKKIRADTENKLGLKRVPETIYNYIENHYLFVQDEDDLVKYRDELRDHLIELASIFPKIDIGNHLSGTAQSNTTKFRKQKCFDRRLHLVTFISDEILNLDNLKENSLKPSKRIKWNPICDEWNKQHPYDTMTVSVIKREYFRARLEIEIQKEYFKRKHEEFDTVFEPIRKLLGVNVDKEPSLGDSWIDLNLEYEKRMEAQNEAKKERNIDNEKEHSQGAMIRVKLKK